MGDRERMLKPQLKFGCMLLQQEKKEKLKRDHFYGKAQKEEEEEDGEGLYLQHYAQAVSCRSNNVHLQMSHSKRV